MSAADAEPARVDALARKVEALAERVADVEEENDRLREELADERAERERAEREREQLEKRVDALAAKVEDHRTATAELQSRELEKGAHLRAESVGHRADLLDVDGDRIERFEKDAGTFVRLPGSDDPLDRGGSTRLDHSDLLPIQQLARLDDDMLASTTGSRPDRLAAELWREFVDDGAPWSKGSGSVRKFVDSSDLRTWIRARESGVNREYGGKLAQRTMDALADLARDRVYIERREQRKNGLRYAERRLVVPSDADLPGDAPPETNDGRGE